jgi:hypothetical protein
MQASEFYNYEPLNDLPVKIQQDFGAALQRNTQTAQHWYLVEAHETEPQTWQEGKIIVHFIFDDGLPASSVDAAFHYSTCPFSYTVGPAFKWNPPTPHKAHVVPTNGGGEIEEVQGSVIQAGGTGGMTVCVLDPAHSSDVVTGAGALADHTGLYLTFQLR